MAGGPRFEVAEPRYINPFELDANELVALIEAKSPRAIGNWRELGAEEYARSFTAAQTIGYDVVHDLYEGLLANLAEEDATEGDFAARVMPVLRRKGWLPDLSDQALQTRLFLIYDTNLRTSQATGRWARIQRTKLALPYLLGFTAKDERVRHPPKDKLHDHRAFEGILLPVDHSFWLDYFPPLGFRCRCSVVQRTRGQVARAGLAVTSEAELAERRERLGPPWGFSPARDSLGGVREAAERANQERLTGAPPISPERMAGLGAQRWNELLAAGAREAVEALIKNLFG